MQRRGVINLTVELELKRLSSKMDEHEKRHDREYQFQCGVQSSCSNKFEKIFDALGAGVATDTAHRSRLNGFEKREIDQDKDIRELRGLINKWFGGLIFTLIMVALTGYFVI